MILRLFLFFLALGFFSGCDRRLPPSCYDFVPVDDYGRFQLKSGGLAYDPKNDIEWFRCSVGQRLVKEECIGIPMIVSWTEAVGLDPGSNAASSSSKTDTRVTVEILQVIVFGWSELSAWWPLVRASSAVSVPR